MLYKETKDYRNEKTTITIDQLVPEDHLVRKLALIDLSFIYDLVAPYYAKNGPDSIDPVMLIQIVILQHVFGVKSMRQIIKEIEVNMAYRWYLGIGFENDKIPHFTTYYKVYNRKFKGTDVYEQIFKKIVELLIENGLVDVSKLFVDGTHFKASANRNKYKSKPLKLDKPYKKTIDEAIRLNRKKRNQKQLKEDKDDKLDFRKVSTTDPECGWYAKNKDRDKLFAYNTNVCCDKNRFVLDFIVSPGNINDGTSFEKLYNTKIKNIKGVNFISADSGYSNPAIIKMIADDGIIPVIAKRNSKSNKGLFTKEQFKYNEETDTFICPNGCSLKHLSTNRNGYVVYASDCNDCKNCPLKEKCTTSKGKFRTVSRHVLNEYVELANKYRNQYDDIYNMRKETIELVFANGKQNHNLGFTNLRGIQKVKDELALKFACLNLKKLAIWMDNNKGNPSIYLKYWNKMVIITNSIHKKRQLNH